MELTDTCDGRLRMERLLLPAGVLLLAFYLAARIQGALSLRSELQRFWGDQKTVIELEAWPRWHEYENPDMWLWSQHRVDAYKAAANSSTWSLRGSPEPAHAPQGSKLLRQEHRPIVCQFRDGNGC